MKNNGATRSDKIALAAWRVLGEAGVDLLRRLIWKIEEQEQLSGWRVC